MRGFVVALMVGLLAFSAPAMAQYSDQDQQPPAMAPGDPCQTADGQQGVLVDENGTLACRVARSGLLDIAIVGVGAAGVLLGVVLLGGSSGNGPASP
jgi:hypothetical protein